MTDAAHRAASPTRIAAVYVMFEEYDFLEQQIAALNARTSATSRSCA
jgi:hypothetical protein